MPRYKTKTTYIDAVLFDGNNGTDIQAIAGTHAVDSADKYHVPNFDYADYWWPNRIDRDVVGVLWTSQGWQGVKVGDVLYQVEGDGLHVMGQQEFLKTFEEA